MDTALNLFWAMRPLSLLSILLLSRLPESSGLAAYQRMSYQTVYKSQWPFQRG
jgi:hypothetical protein